MMKKSMNNPTDSTSESSVRNTGLCQVTSGVISMKGLGMPRWKVQRLMRSTGPPSDGFLNMLEGWSKQNPSLEKNPVS